MSYIRECRLWYRRARFTARRAKRLAARDSNWARKPGAFCSIDNEY